MSKLNRLTYSAVAGATALALIAAAPALAAPVAAPSKSQTAKCGKPKKNTDGSLRNVLCPNGKPNSLVKKYLTNQSSFVMNLGTGTTVEDLSVAVCGDIKGVSYPIVLDAYTYIYAANKFKAPLPTVKALGLELVDDSNPLGCGEHG